MALPVLIAGIGKGALSVARGTKTVKAIHKTTNVAKGIAKSNKEIRKIVRKRFDHVSMNANSLEEISMEIEDNISLDYIERIEKYDVLVGIPAETSGRRQQGITNAELAFIHTNGVVSRGNMAQIQKLREQTGSTYTKAQQMFIQSHGSPAYRVPPRPIIEPAIEDEENSAKIQIFLDKAVDAFLDGNEEVGKQNLEKAGMMAQNVVRDWFTNPKNNWAPNAPSTIKAWQRKHNTLGSDKNPLIDLGELRKSITYVVKTPEGRIVKTRKSTRKTKVK